MTPTTTHPTKENPFRVEKGIRYVVTGCAAHSRLVPLLPSDWNDESAQSGSDGITVPDFLWENAPRRETQSYRDNVKCYSHLPNGTAILDDKWALARLFAARQEEVTSLPHLATLESHCFRGITGFQAFCDRVAMWSTNDDDDQKPTDRDNDYEFRDLLSSKVVSNTSSRTSPSPKNLWVIKDANSNGAGGIWIVGQQNAKEFANHSSSPLLEEHRYVAQRYAWPPMLYGGRKFHVRVYGLMTCDGRAFVHKRAFLHVANEAFSYGESDFVDSVHITNCCANSHDKGKFAGEICADLEATEFGDGQTVVSLADFFPSISASVAELSRRTFPFLRGGEANNGFEYLGMDFILSHDADNRPIAYLLEVNAPPSQDTATGLSHAESLHDNVIRDILSLWVLPKVTGYAFETSGGWKCVHDGRKDIVCDGSLIVPSKAAILNKIRWAIYERKSSKTYEEAASRARDTTDVAVHGKDSHVARELSPSDVAVFARSQFPFFRDNEDNSSSPLRRRPQIFFENAGGSQVPYQVIDAVSTSLSHRNRSVQGQESKKAARRVLSTILGADVDEHAIFLGANASSLFEVLAQRYVESGLLSANDEIVISTENHLANVTPWLSAARTVGATIKWWHVEGPDYNRHHHQDKDGSHDLRQLLTKRTRVLAISHASNILGQLRDIKATCKLAKECTDEYVHVVVDGVAAVPHSSASVLASGVDWYGVSCHKLFGPHLGALCGRRAIVESLHPSTTCSCNNELYKVLENGTINYEGCAGVCGIAEYFAALANSSTRVCADRPISDPLQTRNQCTESRRDRHEGSCAERCSKEVTKERQETGELNERDVKEAYERIRLSEVHLVNLLRVRLEACHNIHLVESRDDNATKLPVFSFLHRVIPSREIVDKCRDYGIVCRQSVFLSTDALQAYYGFGPNNGVVRVSLCHYNTVAEVEYLMERLESLPKWWER